MQRPWLWLLLVCYAGITHAQNPEYARRVIEQLCSEKMAGRGYVNEGDKKAADFIASEFDRLKLTSFNGNFRQEFGFPVIRFPGRMDVAVDDIALIPGEEFIINPGCPNVKGRFKIVYVDSATIDNTQQFNDFLAKPIRSKFLFLDAVKEAHLIHPERIAELREKTTAKGFIECNHEYLTWSVATEWDKYPVIQIKKGRLHAFLNEIELNIESQHAFHNTQNIIGYIPGKNAPDSFLVFTAHYDHLGMMGSETYFPGANDNAGGIAMLLDLADYFKQHPPEFSVAFMAFAGEEVGLFGSYYYTRNPLFPLSKISTLINLDLVTTGDLGLTVVNATEFPEAYAKLVNLNKMMGYLPDIQARGKAQNSDHYFFSEAGIRSFFFYLRGDYHQYHDIHDEASRITLSRYEQAFKLISSFAELMQFSY